LFVKELQLLAIIQIYLQSKYNKINFYLYEINNRLINI